MYGNNELITAQALAQALDLSVDTVWRYTREKRIPFVELGNKQYRYNLAEVINALNGSAVREKAAPYSKTPSEKPAPKEFTYQDYLLLPEEPGYRYEVLDGLLVKEPSPNVMHQRASRQLQRILEDYFWQHDSGGEIFGAPLDVTLYNNTVVQPDLFYVSGDQKAIVKDTRIDGSPALAVEVLSPSGGRKDRLQKLRIYQKAGIQHYWLVDPLEKTLECFMLRDGVYTLIASGMEDDVVEHLSFPGLSVPLKNLWQAGPF